MTLRSRGADRRTTIRRATEAILVVAAVLLAVRAWRVLESGGGDPPGIRMSRSDWVAASTQGVLGAPGNAKVVLVEYIDFECEYCRRAHPVVEALRAEHAGVVEAVFRLLPNSRTSSSFSASVAMVCAARVGHAERAMSALYRAAVRANLDSAALLARDLGIAETAQPAFRFCMSDRRTQGLVEEEQAQAIRLGVASTPTFALNGRWLANSSPVAVRAAVAGAVSRAR